MVTFINTSDILTPHSTWRYDCSLILRIKDLTGASRYSIFLSHQMYRKEEDWRPEIPAFVFSEILRGFRNPCVE